MHFGSCLSFLAVLPAVYSAVHESLHALPHGWRRSSVVVSDDAVVTLQVSLQYRNIDLLEPTLKRVSDPSSEEYGEYRDIDSVNDLFAPSDDDHNTVVSWLVDSDANNIESDGHIVTFTTTVGNANSMLNTAFHLYTDGQSTLLRTTQYSIPDHMVGAIDIITPTTYFGRPQRSSMEALQKARLAAVTRSQSMPPEKRQFSKSCEITEHFFPKGHELVLGPTCIKEMYNIGDYNPDATSGSSIAFGSFLHYSANPKNLAAYEKYLGLPPHNFTNLALINGGQAGHKSQVNVYNEADLDVQTIVGLVGDLPIGQYVTGGRSVVIPDPLVSNKPGHGNEPWLQYFQYLLSQPNSNLPHVISNSYYDHEDTVPPRYAARVCNMIAMLGMRGRSILFCSGDEGVGAVCRSNTGDMKLQFSPQFPASCPYATSVGGTNRTNPEWAWVASGGGFSNYWAAPWYQRKAIATYLQEHISSDTKGYYASNDYVNFSGRGFPDIAAHSDGPPFFDVTSAQENFTGAGTSASAPIWASVVALLNDARFRAGKPAMGFINPWLYENAGAAQAMFHDITIGGSQGCSGDDRHAGIIPYASWNATEGWDPVTGLGTPNFAKLKAIALQG